MKTSATQFEMLVNFMEQHGDINKPTKDARGRVKAIENWARLTNLLNADPVGDNKTMEKWKKVWSDLKNNTKKKAAKINKAACGTGGGPALQTKLTDLEQRVLRIIGSQAATGLVGVMELGFSQEPDQNVSHDSDRTRTLSTTPTLQAIIEESPSILTIEGNVNIVTDEIWNQPGSSHQPHVPRPPSPILRTPPPPSPVNIRFPDLQGHTPRRRGVRRNLTSPRRRRPQSYADQAADHFLNADLEFRNFLKRQHEDNKEIELRKLQLRESELQSQQRWQDITMLAIAALNKIVDKYSK
ncbi:hypothetical protein ACJJTC_019379 [Scirpophaga incertulas]